MNPDPSAHVFQTLSGIGVKLKLVLILCCACPSVMQTACAAQANLEKRIPVKIIHPEQRDLEIWESSVGQLEAKVAPLIAAEVPGPLIQVYVDVGDRIQQGQLLAEIDAEDFQLARDMARADIERLQALLHAQQLKVKRFRELVKKNSVNQSKLDDAEAQYSALRAELRSAGARLQKALHDIRKTRITSPIEGRVDATQVSRGDYVVTGSPLMRLVDLHILKARLPYPESLLSELEVGLPVRLRFASEAGLIVETFVSEVRPSITFGSRAAQVIVNLENPGGWKPGATVSGAVQIARHEQATLLPEICVVRRPVGTVVYVAEEDRARQQLVTIGLTHQGKVEILSGVSIEDRVIADGAGFLTDQTLIAIIQP